MNLEYYFWVFKKAVPDHICDDMIKYGLQRKETMATTGGYSDVGTLTPPQIKDLKKKRDSNIMFFNEAWMFKELLSYVNLANRNAGWNFQWDHGEVCQFTKYNKGQYYGWHTDSWHKAYDKPNTPSHGKIRKLSVTLSLSDPKTYVGGELEFDFRNLDPDKKPVPRICKEIRPKGSLVIFPSEVWHRVRPVTKGTRYSLVVWYLGAPFK